MDKGRYKLTEEDIDMFDAVKNLLAFGVEKLVESGIRKTNIEIEITHYLKNLLKED